MGDARSFGHNYRFSTTALNDYLKLSFLPGIIHFDIGSHFNKALLHGSGRGHIGPLSGLSRFSFASPRTPAFRAQSFG